MVAGFGWWCNRFWVDRLTMRVFRRENCEKVLRPVGAWAFLRGPLPRPTLRLAWATIGCPFGAKQVARGIGRLLILAGILVAARARADVYVLHNGGRVEGELANQESAPVGKFVVRTGAGIDVTIEKAQVKEIIPQGAADAEYEKIRPTFADTVEDQWRLAEWCKEHAVPKGREAALARVIELDPEHREARLALGYTKIDGRWVQPDQLMQERGRVKYQGQWLLPQEVEVLERRRKDELAEKQWYLDMKRWRNWLRDPAKVDQYREQIARISDPYATGAVVQALERERDPVVRMWYVKALGRIGSSGAIKTLVEHSLSDNEEAIRVECIDQIVKSKG